MKGQVIVAFSYDTEQAIPKKLPEHIISPSDYSILSWDKKKKVWADYIRDNVWNDPNQHKLSLKELKTLKELSKLFNEFGGNFTSFILGQWLNFVVDSFGQQNVKQLLTWSNVDIQSHSYHHKTYQSTGDKTRDRISPPLSIKEIDTELQMAIESLQKHLGIRPIGLRTPMGNISPFSEEELFILESFRKNKIQFVSSWLKKSQKTPNTPENAQPFFYSTLGFNDILEIPGVGYYDVHYTQPTRMLVFDDDKIWTQDERTGYYIGLVENAIRLASEQKKQIFVPFVYHPAIINQYDPDFQFHRDLLNFCKTENVRIWSYKQIYDSYRN